ncbi:MAG: hypothetical protein MSA20_08565 [Bacteroidales bacterium]|nr:hypothetical protein [Bacteroidales bacterium]
MTNLGDLLGKTANDLMQLSIKIGDVHLLQLDPTNGITPKNGDVARNKFFIVLGFDNEGNVVGGLVINSKINYNLPPTITDYQLPITVTQCPFLQHNSFVNCSKIIVAKRTNFNRDTYRGEISDSGLMRLIIDTVKESPTVNKKQLKDFGIN